MQTNIDKKDLKILDILKENARLTTRQIAKKTNLPITTVHHRMRKLETKRVIKSYTILPDHQALDKGLLVYVLISVSLILLKEKQKSQYDIAKKLKSYPFIERVDIVSGGADLIAVVRVKDVSAYDEVLLNMIQRVEGVEKTQSLIVLHANE